MILTEKVNLVITPSNMKRYKDLGYDVKWLDVIEVPVSTLSKCSSAIIEYKCDVCGKIKKITYDAYNDKKKVGSGIDTCGPKCGRAKTEITNMKKYGCISPTQNKDILKIREENYIKKYGQKTNLLCEETKEKIRKTTMEKYGTENPSQSDIIKKRKEEVCMKRYGVKNPLQCKEIFEKQQVSSYKMENVFGFLCRGSYEKDFIIKYKDKIKITKPKSVHYEHKGQDKVYHPDFYVPSHNLIVEVKSSYTYNYDVDMNENKRRACLEHGYNFIFIIDKNYVEFEKLLS